MDAEKENKRLREAMIIVQSRLRCGDNDLRKMANQAYDILGDALRGRPEADVFTESIYEEWPMEHAAGYVSVCTMPPHSIPIPIWRLEPGKPIILTGRQYRFVAYIHERGNRRVELQQLMAWHPSNSEAGIALSADHYAQEGRWIPAVAVKMERICEGGSERWMLKRKSGGCAT